MRSQAFLTVLLGCASSALALGCQNQDDHPAYAAACAVNCAPASGVSLGPGMTGTPTQPTPDSDGGTVDITGKISLLTDATFLKTSPFTQTGAVSADGASGVSVTANWDGTNPYSLEGVAVETSNWFSVRPDDVQGDAQLTYQPVFTTGAGNVDLFVVSGVALDNLFTGVSSVRSPSFAQVVLFFRSTGTGGALAGLHVSMPAAQIAAYSSANGFILDDGTAVTDATGLVVFGNVDSTKANGGTQSITVTRAATATSAAVAGGTFAIKVVEGAVTFENVNVQL